LSHSLVTSSVGVLDLENIGVAVGIAWLSALEAKHIYEIPICDFKSQFGRTVMPLVLMDCWIFINVVITFCNINNSSLEATILDLPLPDSSSLIAVL